MNEESKSKTELLKELESLGIGSSGRRIRNDKGQTRGKINGIRSDKGKYRLKTNGLKRAPQDIYLSVKNKVLRSNSDTAQKVALDINNIFIVAVGDNRTVEKYHKIISHGQEVHRTVKHVQGTTIDLEKYRFNALQELALSNNTVYNKTVFTKEFDDTKTDNWLDLFCMLYRIKEEDLIKWSYDKWRAYYNIVCSTKLPLDFKFEYNKKPGTAEFMPEFAEELNLLSTQEQMKIVSSKEYINMHSKIYDEEYAKEFIKAKTYVLRDQPSLTMVQIEKIARGMINKDELTKRVKARLDLWLEDKMNKGE